MPKFIVEFTDSPHFPRGKRYLEIGPGFFLIRNRKDATRFDTREEAQRQADRRNWPNGWKGRVAEVAK